MAVETAVITGFTRTTVGTQDYTSAGFGTPQAAIIIYSTCNSASNPAPNAKISIGFTDGTRQSVSQSWSRDAQGSTSTNRYDTTNAVLIDYPGSVSAIANFDSWVTDGIRLNYTNPTTNADYVTIILLKGASNVFAASYQLTTTGVNDITAPGFKPDLVFCTCTGLNVPNTGASNAILSFGAAHNNSSDVVTQGQICFTQRNAVQSATGITTIRDDSFTGQFFDGVQSWKGVAQDFDASGFSVNTGSDSPGNDFIYYLAIQLDSPDDADVSIIDTPITTGVESYSQPGFKPGLLILGQGFSSAVNVTTNAGAYAVGSADASAQYCNGLTIERGVFPTNTQTNYSTTAVSELYAENGSATTHDATLSSFTASGFNLNFSKTDTTARKWLAITLKDTGAAPPAVTGNAIMFGTNF